MESNGDGDGDGYTFCQQKATYTSFLTFDKERKKKWNDSRLDCLLRIV